MELPSPLALEDAYRHLVACYPEEGCGVIVQRADGSWQAVPIANVYDRLRAEDPMGHPRNARTAYSFDLREFLRVSSDAARRGDRIACLFHSHVDGAATFSDEDRQFAAPDGVPMYPGVLWLVVAVESGRVASAKFFTWDYGDFREHPAPTAVR